MRTCSTALAEARPRLRSAVGHQARVKRTPELVFRPDDVVRGARRVEDLLRGLPEPSADADAGAEVDPDGEGRGD